MYYDQTRNLDAVAGPAGGDPLIQLRALAQGRALAVHPDETYGLMQVAAWLRTNVVKLFDWIIDHHATLKVRPVRDAGWPGGYSLTGEEVLKIVKGLVTKGGPDLLKGDAAFSNEELATLTDQTPKQTAGIARRLFGTDGQAFRIGRNRFFSYGQAEEIVRHAVAGTQPEPRTRGRATASTAIVPTGRHSLRTSPVTPPALPGPLPVTVDELEEIEGLLRRESGSPAMKALLEELRPVYLADPTIALNELLDALLGLHAEGRDVLLHVLRVARRAGAAH